MTPANPSAQEHEIAGYGAESEQVSFEKMKSERDAATNELGYIKATLGAVGDETALAAVDRFKRWSHRMAERKEPNAYMLITIERERQNQKWGEQNHDAPIWASIAGEEMGEVHQAILHDLFGGRAKGTLRTEITHVAAVCVQWLECLERNGY